MKVSAVISKPNLQLKSSDKSAILSGVAIAVGILVGSVLYVLNKDALAKDLIDYFISFSLNFANKNKPEIISGLIMQNLVYFIAMLILGTSFIGTPAVYAISAIKSAGLGLLATYIYDSFALKGIEYCLLVLFPGKFILIFAMILLTQNCGHTSSEVLTSIKHMESRGVDFRKFTARSLLILIILFLSSVVDFFTLISFSQLFDFG